MSSRAISIFVHSGYFPAKQWLQETQGYSQGFNGKLGGKVVNEPPCSVRGGDSKLAIQAIAMKRMAIRIIRRTVLLVGHWV